MLGFHLHPIVLTVLHRRNNFLPMFAVIFGKNGNVKKSGGRLITPKKYVHRGKQMLRKQISLLHCPTTNV